MTQEEIDLKDYYLIKETIDALLEDRANLPCTENVEDIYCNIIRAYYSFAEAEDTYPELYRKLERTNNYIGLEGEPYDYPDLEDPYIDEDFDASPEEFMIEFRNSIMKDSKDLEKMFDDSRKEFERLPVVMKNSQWGKRQIRNYEYNINIIEGLNSFINDLTETMQTEGKL